MNVLNNYLFTFSKNSKNRIKNNFISQILKYISCFNTNFISSIDDIIYGLENFGIWVFSTAIPNAFAILNLNLNDAVNGEMF